MKHPCPNARVKSWPALLLLCMLGFACKSRQPLSVEGNLPERDGKVPLREMLDGETYLLVEMEKSPRYGYSEKDPILTGGVKESRGPQNQRRFLNALMGPNGERVSYFRQGSCCGFKTPNGLLGGEGLLDRYGVTWEGSQDTVYLYLNLYDYGELKVPVGFTSKKKPDKD